MRTFVIAAYDCTFFFDNKLHIECKVRRRMNEPNERGVAHTQDCNEWMKLFSPQKQSVFFFVNNSECKVQECEQQQKMINKINNNNKTQKGKKEWQWTNYRRHRSRRCKQHSANPSILHRNSITFRALNCFTVFTVIDIIVVYFYWILFSVCMHSFSTRRARAPTNSAQCSQR